MRVEAWRDEHGFIRELVHLELDAFGGSCVVREWNPLDALDGDSREGCTIVARFEDPAEAREFLLGDGFEPIGD